MTSVWNSLNHYETGTSTQTLQRKSRARLNGYSYAVFSSTRLAELMCYYFHMPQKLFAANGTGIVNIDTSLHINLFKFLKVHYQTEIYFRKNLYSALDVLWHGIGFGCIKYEKNIAMFYQIHQDLNKYLCIWFFYYSY